MSKAEIPRQGKYTHAQVSQANYPSHLATTERGVALARHALAEAHDRAIEANESRRRDLERIHAEDKAIIAGLRVEMYGAGLASEVEPIEAEGVTNV